MTKCFPTFVQIQKLDSEQLEELREAFNLFDSDGNGKFLFALSGLWDHPCTSRTLDNCFRSCSFPEFAPHSAIKCPYFDSLLYRLY